mmetsp:Transcript_15742/g.28677  ORF Transcript_15742/g.28677 Transcript_15742/m.28677 type:complete len:421 (-) Transcript_15742:215-1477(-)
MSEAPGEDSEQKQQRGSFWSWITGSPSKATEDAPCEQEAPSHIEAGGTAEEATAEPVTTPSEPEAEAAEREKAQGEETKSDEQQERDAPSDATKDDQTGPCDELPQMPAQSGTTAQLEDLSGFLQRRTVTSSDALLSSVRVRLPDALAEGAKEPRSRPVEETVASLRQECSKTISREQQSETELLAVVEKVLAADRASSKWKEIAGSELKKWRSGAFYKMGNQAFQADGLRTFVDVFVQSALAEPADDPPEKVMQAVLSAMQASWARELQRACEPGAVLKDKQDIDSSKAAIAAALEEVATQSQERMDRLLEEQGRKYASRISNGPNLVTAAVGARLRAQVSAWATQSPNQSSTTLIQSNGVSKFRKQRASTAVMEGFRAQLKRVVAPVHEQAQATKQAAAEVREVLRRCEAISEAVCVR